MQKFFYLTFFILVITTLANTNKEKSCCGESQTVSVTGKGRASVTTDSIKIGFKIETIEKSALTSYEKNNKIAQEVNRKFKLLGLNEKNLKTAGYSIEKRHESKYNRETNSHSREFIGFAVTNKIQIEVTSIRLVAVILDQALEAGVHEVDYIRFEVDKKHLEMVKKNLIMSAAKNAFDKAQLAARGLNMKIKDVQTITVNDYSIPTYKKYARSETLRVDDAGSILYNNDEETYMSISVKFLIEKLK